MTPARLTAFVGLAAAVSAFRAGADEVNVWPLYVLREDPSGHTQSWSSLGPLLFSGPAPKPDAGQASGFRPLYVKMSDGEKETTDILYPLFFYRRYPDAYKWSIFHIVNHEGILESVTRAGGPTDRHLDIWPFYFSHETADPIDTYHALFPVYGTMKYRLGYDRLSWVLFPLYAGSQRRDTSVTYAPWPVLRVIQGAESGFALWPLAGATRGPGTARHFYCLWPLVWDNTLDTPPEAPAGTAPAKQLGFLPFYTREAGPGSVIENYLWPFFGYTERTSPSRYSERRYLWPFLVQGHGDDKAVNRWGPFFTHSYSMGSDSTWIGWPLWHRTTWADGGISQSRTQFFYFLYWSLDQTSVARPSLAPAYKRHIWPLVSIWDNGAGSRQIQMPSLTEVFFPDNPDVRQAWAQLFSIYRYDRRPTGETRNSLLWDAVTWRRDASKDLVELHFGPVLGMRRLPSGPRWSILGFDFGAKLGNDRQPSR
ncbi:MAG TPA: hypothetical protein VN775_03735 [Opitutaceae bacterium]|nr:hypothetical protein [Opitutaceae bacterium]